MTSTDRIEFFPFFDPKFGDKPLSWSMKLVLALGMGAFYVALQYVVLPDKEVFFRDYCWILGLIISVSLLAVYVAVEVFRTTLKELRDLDMDYVVSRAIVDNWLNDKCFLISGVGFALLTAGVGYTLGIPPDLHFTFLSLAATYLGYLLAGFSAGMGLLGIVAVIMLYLNIAPTLQHALNPSDPDGTGGIKKLGDALWIFGALIFAVGFLVAIYLFGVTWSNLTAGFAQNVFLLWLSLPFILGISVVLIPGLAVRRHVTYYKTFKEQQLKQEKARLYAAYRKFADTDDAAIIHEKKELSAKMNRIQDELEKLKAMRNSHLDG